MEATAGQSLPLQRSREGRSSGLPPAYALSSSRSYLPLEALREAKARADQALERYNRSVAQR
ncbi:hypothetical protein [Thermus antranikianii]|uniref:hypothetical protein n=1 Tax=Thermus antranikianii TaxID=88190 RepID=UPI0019AFBB2D|nr:hypothetical protein [Thermus antranikianii]QWK21042.1 MAG: hypothetical protein KNN15_08265 [Thermus antranikianii]